jgi:hypothetical protein
MDYNNLTFDMEVKAIYSASASVVEGDLVSDDSQTPVVLVQGVFDPAASVHVEDASVKPPEVPAGQDLIMNYEISVEHDVKPSEEDQAVDVRVYAPESSSKYTVYTYRDGAWEKVSTSRDGSYLVFNSPDRDVTFAVTKGAGHSWLWILLGVGALLLAGLLFWLLKRRSRSAKKSGGTSKAMPSYPEQPITPVSDEVQRVTVPAEEPVLEEAAEIPEVEEIPEPYEDVIIEEAGEIVSNFVPDDPDAE